MTEIQAGWPTHPRPTRYVHRDLLVDFDTGGDLQFFFANNHPAMPMNGKSIEDIVADLPRAGATGPGFWNWLWSSHHRETPLDIGLREDGPPIYVIFRIIGPANMFFHPTRNALALARATAGPRYGLLRHVDAAGTPQEAPRAGSKIAYFACKPSAITGDSDEFMLRIRFEQQPHVGPPPRPRILDIDIDPDIRFPGTPVD